jgi:DHA2 family multidrug resistance protein
VIYTRSPVHGVAIMARLQAGDIAAAKFVGIPLDVFAARPAGPIDGATHAMMQPLVEKAALVQAINEAWVMVAALTVAALLCVPFAKVAPPKQSAHGRL